MAAPEPTVNQAKNQAYRLLALRNRTVSDIRNRLRQRGYDIITIERALQELAAEGYLDDRKYALSWARYRLETKPLGRKRLAWDLRRRGVSSETIDGVLHEIYTEFDETTLAEQAIAKRCANGNDLRSPIERRRCLRYLMNLGFDAELVTPLLDSIASPELSDQ